MWMRDIKFFCLNLLLAFLSTQLYNDTSIGNTINSNYDKEDIFLSYLYRKAEFQLRVALGPSSAGNSKLFSDSLAVQLVRGLLIHCSYDCESCHSTGGSFLGASRGESSINSLLLSELLNRFGTKKYTTTQKPSDHIISMNTIKNLVLGGYIIQCIKIYIMINNHTLTTICFILCFHLLGRMDFTIFTISFF